MDNIFGDATSGILSNGTSNIEYIPSLSQNVSIGFTKDYSYTMSRRTFGTTFIVGMLFLLLFFLVILGLMVYVAYTSSNVPSTPVKNDIPTKIDPILNNNTILNENVGGVNYVTQNISNCKLLEPECRKMQNTIWNGKNCECKNEYYGENCNFLKHDKKYFNIGNISKHKSNIKIIKVLKDIDKSFTENSCSKQCDLDKNCNGFLYKDRNCTLIENMRISEKENTDFDINKESTLYFKDIDQIQFDGIVYLYKTYSNNPKRIWIKNDKVVSIKIGRIKKIDFKPVFNSIPIGNIYGIYSKNEFYQNDIISMLKSINDEVYIHKASEILKFPFTWNNTNTIYVSYIDI